MAQLGLTLLGKLSYDHGIESSRIEEPIIKYLYENSSINQFCQVQKVDGETCIINDRAFILDFHNIYAGVNVQKANYLRFKYNLDIENELKKTIIKELEHFLEKEFLRFLNNYSNLLNISFYKQNIFRPLINFFLINGRYSFKAKKISSNNLLTDIVKEQYRHNFDFVNDECTYLIISPQIAQFVAAISDFEITRNWGEGPLKSLKFFGILTIFENKQIKIYLNPNNEEQNSMYFGIKKRKGFPQLLYNAKNSYYTKPNEVFNFGVFHRFISDEDFKYSKIILNI